ncbi:MAG: site-2 protease family protein [Candidatus Omnitrophica bacterium]|nr:site-2 protease family protein [Candidatus Omnitrophota bacterium]
MFVILAIPLLYSVIAHEVAHGWVAYLFGDNTAKHSGRLTFNPAVHLDPMGTLALFFVGFGWAKPVPVNYANLKNFRLGLICVALAGCVTNILIATIALSLLRIGTISANPLAVTVLFVVARVNIILGAFNLIPIPPLDGSKVLMGFLPFETQRVLASIEPYGFFVLIFLLFTGLLSPVIGFVQNIIIFFIGLVLR